MPESTDNELSTLSAVMASNASRNCEVVLAADGVDRLYPDVVSRFDRMVSLHGGKTALRGSNACLDYRALSGLSDRVAGELSERGVGASDCVGLAGRNGLQTVVALLGILKAGAHYAYLNDADPAPRLRQMAERLAIRHVLCVGGTGAELSTLGPFCLDVADIQAAGPGRPVVTPDAEAIAYVNFSSGSTGEPKAITCCHRGIVRLCMDQPVLGLDASTVMLVNAPLSFDASTLEIWGPLLNGGQCVFHDESLLTPAGLRRLIRLGGVNTLWLTSALFNTIIDLDAGCVQGARAVLTGGEILSVAHMRRAMRANPQVRFINGYGPTENTTFTTCHPLTEADLLRPSLPIGTPINGTGVAICDESLKPLPAGRVGELVTFGAGLAHGYLDNPELEAVKFRWLELHGVPRRVYLTGDLARLGEDGLLYYHGRKDREVKINGFRIDLAELEDFLRGCPLVRDCALLDVEQHGGKLLLAAIVPAGQSGAEALTAVVARWIAQLPPHERPHVLFAVETLPLTVNGKLDRAALLERWRAGAIDPAGLSALERGCATLWERHAGCLPPSRQSDFFAVGGNSLLALRLLADAARLLGQEIPLPMAEFYRASRFDDFCRWLAERGGERAVLPAVVDSALIRVRPAQSPALEEAISVELARYFPEDGGARLFQYRGELFLSGETASLEAAHLEWLASRHRQAVATLAGRTLEIELNPYQRSMALDELFNGNLDGNSMFYQLKPAAAWSDERLQRANETIYRSYPLLNARVSLQGDCFVFQLDENAQLPELIRDDGGYADDETFCRRYLYRRHSVFERGYLRLVRSEAAGTPVFGLWLHHIAADAHFMGRLLRELRAVLEEGAQSGEADFSFAQQNWYIARQLARERDNARSYWAELRPRLGVIGTESPPGLGDETQMVERDCVFAAHKDLLQWAISRKQGLLSIFAVLLGRACKRTLAWRPQLILTTCTQRNRGISPDGAGCYINLLPLLLEQDDGDVTRAIAATDRTALQAMAAGCLPYEEMAEACVGLREKAAVLINIVEERWDHPHGWAVSRNQSKARRPLTLTVFLSGGRLARLTLAGRFDSVRLEALLEDILDAAHALVQERADVRNDLATT